MFQSWHFLCSHPKQPKITKNCIVLLRIFKSLSAQRPNTIDTFPVLKREQFYNTYCPETTYLQSKRDTWRESKMGQKYLLHLSHYSEGCLFATNSNDKKTRRRKWVGNNSAGHSGNMCGSCPWRISILVVVHPKYWLLQALLHFMLARMHRKWSLEITFHSHRCVAFKRV